MKFNFAARDSGFVPFPALFHECLKWSATSAVNVGTRVAVCELAVLVHPLGYSITGLAFNAVFCRTHCGSNGSLLISVALVIGLSLADASPFGSCHALVALLSGRARYSGISLEMAVV